MDKQSLAIRTRQWYEIVLEAGSSCNSIVDNSEWRRFHLVTLKP